jgi:hypothetical protein
MKRPGLVLGLALLVLLCSVSALLVKFSLPFAQARYVETYPELRRELREDIRPEVKAGEEFPVPFEPLPKTITPCRACHGPEKDFPVNYRRREALLVHTGIELNHGGVRVWCLDCHHPEKRNYLLPLSDGKLIEFEHSYLLCGKCHGTIYRDWRHGIHGRRTGYWNGKKMYRLCTQCHDPHSPRFQPIEPMPPPHKPRTPEPQGAGRP